MVKESKLLIKKALAVGESKTQFHNLLYGLREEFKPKGVYENLILDKLVIDICRLKKLLNYEKEYILKSGELKYGLPDRDINTLVTYYKSIEKSVEKGFSELKRIKKSKSPFGL